MARPIEPTPILQGQDAERFVQTAQNPKQYAEPRFDLKAMHNEAKKFIKKHESK